MAAIPVLRFTAQPGGAPLPELRADGQADRVLAPAGGEPLTVLRGRDEVLQCITGRAWVMAGITSDGGLRGHPLTGAEQQDPDGGLLNMNPPAHTALRGRITRLFTHAAAAAVRKDAEAVAAELALRLCGRTSVDLAAEFIDPFTAAVICRSLGVDDWDTILTGSVNAFAPVPGPEAVAGVDDGWREIYRFYTRVVTAGLARPDGIVAQVTRAFRGLTLRQLVHALANVSNGYPATRQSARRTLWELLANHPAQLAACQRGERSWAEVTDELLSTVALFPVGLPRRAARDTALAGRPFAEGTLAVPSLVAAAHDPRYPAPPRNIAFGYGPHTCPGGPLARMWIACALEVLFALHPRARLTGEEPHWEGDSLAVPHQIMATLR